MPRKQPSSSTAPKSPQLKISVKFATTTLELLERLVKNGYFQSRGEAVRSLMYMGLVEMIKAGLVKEEYIADRR